MTVICIANQKGGVSKTTIARHLGHYLSQAAGPTLLIDLDPQASLTDIIGIHLQGGHMAAVLGDVNPGTGDIAPIIQRVKDNLFLAPSATYLAHTESALILRNAREYQLRRALETIIPRFTYILIDCPPSLGLLVTNAMMAAQWVIVPTQLDSMSVGGVALFMETLRATQDDYPECARLLGTVATQVDLRTVLGREMLQRLRERDDLKLFDTTIPHTVRFKEAALMKQSIAEYDPAGPGAAAFEALAQEVMKRIQKEP